VGERGLKVTAVAPQIVTYVAERKKRLEQGFSNGKNAHSFVSAYNIFQKTAKAFG